MQKEIKIQILLVFLFGIFLFPCLVFASSKEISLGSFPGQGAAEKIFKNSILQIKDSAFEMTAEDIKKFISEKEDLAYSPSYLSEIENTNFCAYKKTDLCPLFFNAAKQIHIQKISVLSLNKQTLAQFLEDLSRKTDKDPQDAKLQADESGKISVFALSSEGIKLNKEKSAEIMIAHFRNPKKDSIALAYDVIKPEITTDSIDNLGITALIGQGKSNFAGSPKNRTYNIKVATARFNGLLIKPNEEFSFVKNLGPVDAEHGYLPELVIKNNKTEPEFGGGICQVSTTAFRAAIYSGLKITARRNHAYPVKYYAPHGMDSTVYIPYPDLRFKNNTPGHILVQTRIVGTELFFDFYGSPDGRKINIIGPKVTQWNSDGSMKTTFTQEVFAENGEKMIGDVFNSNYDSPSKYPHPGEVQTLTKKTL